MASKKKFKRKPAVGILALQGDFLEHKRAIEALNHEAREVRTIKDLEQVDGLILPGGESTAIGLQLRESGLGQAIQQRAQQDFPLYGTCAGCILLAKKVDSEFSLQLIDITAERNAYGRQIDSFDEPIQSKVFPKLHGVFIRAPRILRVGHKVQILATHGNDPVLVQENNILAGAFHPELTNESAVHRYFIQLVKDWIK